jgi:hypothetical protein
LKNQTPAVEKIAATFFLMNTHGNKNHEPATPVPEAYVHKGLTKREWFAGMALIGMAANYGSLRDHDRSNIAEMAFKMADEMIEHSKK